MDPQKALSNLMTGLDACDREQVSESLWALVEWVDRDGFLPKVRQLRMDEWEVPKAVS